MIDTLRATPLIKLGNAAAHQFRLSDALEAPSDLESLIADYLNDLASHDGQDMLIGKAAEKRLEDYVNQHKMWPRQWRSESKIAAGPGVSAASWRGAGP